MTQLTSLVVLLIVLMKTSCSSAKTKCAQVVGRIHCPTDWDRHHDVAVKLMDRDAWPWEADDKMGETRTDEDGNYRVEGCADDFGSWNDPDLYLLIEHRCPRPGRSISIPFRQKVVEIVQLFLPEIIYIESIRIDEGEETRQIPETT